MAPAGLLLSTPAKISINQSAILISSSPDFPSLLDVLEKPPKKPALCSGSNAAPIPQNAPTSFTTAASFMRSSRAAGEIEIEDLDTPTVSPVIAATAVPVADTPVVPAPAPVGASLSDPKPKSRSRSKPKARTQRTGEKDERTEAPNDGPLELESLPDPPPVLVVADPDKKKTKRGRPAKSATDSQTTLPKGKVTKSTTKAKTSPKTRETVSRHFAAEAKQQENVRIPVAKANDNGPLEPLELGPAVRRRVDWTPPPEDNQTPVLSSSSAVKDARSVPGGAPSWDTRQHTFKNLLDSYGHRAEEGVLCSAATALCDADGPEVLGKRKLVQMVASAGPTAIGSKTPETSPVKKKAPKKKPRTITELATAAYRLPDEADIGIPTEGHEKGSLLGYFDVEHPGPSDAATANSTKATKKTAKPKTSRKKAEPRKPILLSPVSAMRQVAGQDFVFGTASQLATEEDPELLRALQEAMRISNQADYDPFRSSSPVGTDLAVRRRGGNKLWAAGARDDDGDLLEVEVLDLTSSPGLPPDYALPRNLAQIEERSESGPAPPAAERSEVEIPSSDFDILLDMNQRSKSHFFATQNEPSKPSPPSTSALSEPGDTLPVRSLSAPTEPDLEPPPSNQEHNQLIVASQSGSPVKPMEQPEEPPRSKYDLYTDAQLAREITSFGFKSVRKRTAMIALLDQCWTSRSTCVTGKTTQATMSTASSQQAALAPGTSVSAAARPRGRPKKALAGVADAGEAGPQPEKRPRGRPKKDAAPASPAKSAKGKGKGKGKGEAVASEPLPPSQKASQTLAPSTPKRRKAAAREVLEIADSESESDPFASSPASSPEQPREQVFSPTQSQMDLSITDDTEMSLIAVSPTAQQTTLFSCITKAITTAPATRDAAHPSWHEKMLMYDPVILEELAAWLNAGQLDRVGYGKEVSPGEVKRWCESKSVCCLWRVNLHGRERKRF